VRRRPISKSDSVQFKFREILIDPDVMVNFHITTEFEPVDFGKRDELLELTQQLIDQIKNLIVTKLTSRQSEVVQKIYFEQKTQMEVADSLGLCQTTIHKVIMGNLDYSNGGKRYGGALKKLKKLCSADPEIQSVIDKIAQLRRELSE